MLGLAAAAVAVVLFTIALLEHLAYQDEPLISLVLGGLIALAVAAFDVANRRGPA